MMAEFIIRVENKRARYGVSEGETLNYIKKALDYKEYHKIVQISNIIALIAQGNFGGQITWSVLVALARH